MNIVCRCVCGWRSITVTLLSFVLAMLFAGCERIEVPSLDGADDAVTDSAMTDTSNGDVETDSVVADTNNTDANDKYQGFGSLEDQINYGGTYDQPFRVWDLAHGDLGLWIIESGAKLYDCWVEGYVVGYVKGTVMKSARLFEQADRATNVLIADDTLGVSVDDCMPVQLSSGSSYIDVRKALNLVDNPHNMCRKVKVLGALTKYMGVAGMTNSRELVFADDDATDIESVTVSD